MSNKIIKEKKRGRLLTVMLLLLLIGGGSIFAFTNFFDNSNKNGVPNHTEPEISHSLILKLPNVSEDRFGDLNQHIINNLSESFYRIRINDERVYYYYYLIAILNYINEHILIEERANYYIKFNILIIKNIKQINLYLTIRDYIQIANSDLISELVSCENLSALTNYLIKNRDVLQSIYYNSRINVYHKLISDTSFLNKLKELLIIEMNNNIIKNTNFMLALNQDIISLFRKSMVFDFNGMDYYSFNYIKNSLLLMFEGDDFIIVINNKKITVFAII